MRHVILGSVSMLALFASCKGGTSDSNGAKTSTALGETATPTTTATETATSSATETTTEAATDTSLDTSTTTLKLSIDAALSVAAAALQSTSAVTFTTDGGVPVSLDPGTVAISALRLNASPTCDGKGHVTKDETVVFENSLFAAAQAYCDLSQASDGPDTTLGALSRVVNFMCATSNFIVPDGQEHAFDFVMDDTCFGPVMIEQLVEQTGSTSLTQPAVLTAHDQVPDGIAGAGYERFLHVKSEGAFTFDYDIAYTIKDDEIAATVLGLDDNGQKNDVFTVRLTKAGGKATIRYEGRFFIVKDGEDATASPRVSHVRAHAAGDFDEAAGIFTSLDTLEYLAGTTQPVGGDAFVGQIKAVRGTPSGGFRATDFSASQVSLANVYTFDSYTAEVASCYGGGTCEGNEGLVLASPADLDFIRTVDLEAFPQTAVSGPTWFKKHGPLAFTAVSFAGEQD